MRKNDRWMVSNFLIAFWISFSGCATETAPLIIINSVSPDKLAYYEDTFDNFREDLWDKAGFTYKKEQLRNYKSANMRIENGQLVVETPLNSFSKGGIISKFHLRGDFDIQIDCHLDFLKNAGDMDQIISFTVLEQMPSAQANRAVNIAVIKGANERGVIFTSYREGAQNIKLKNWLPTGDFHGSLRIVRTGGSISTFYRKGAGRWKRRGTFPSTGKDTRVYLEIHNFFVFRTSIQATQSLVGRLDNFRINAAQEIVEEEI
jgi:hypothetical protein